MSRPLITPTPHVLRPNPARVITKVFLPGQELLTPGSSRATTVLDRILALSDEQVAPTLAAAMAAFGNRHQRIADTFEARFQLIAHRIADPASVGTDRRRLIGAYFSQEFAVESAALCNPSIVAHPDQTGLPVGSVRFLMSVRSVGEGHISSIGWRTGTMDVHENIAFDAPAGPMVRASHVPPRYSKEQIRRQVGYRASDHRESVEHLLAGLPDHFDRPALDRAMAQLYGQSLTRGSPSPVIERLQEIASDNYAVAFPPDSRLDQRQYMPVGAAESHGVEDLRLVRFTGEDGSVEYRGTYTAFDGSAIAQAILRTEDFLTFRSERATGQAASGKGLALFPRTVGGRQLALSRWDREGTTLAESTDTHNWDVVAELQRPTQPWELVQVGNCGPPIETEAGWLVLTHGVGPVRQYAIGALLLDLTDPSIVLGRLTEPLLTAGADDRDGYVPNVVYTCGGMVHNGTLLLPYGCNDAYIRVATVDLSALLLLLTRGR